jgi:starch synthase
MKILLASAEAVPFAKVGGLADVVPSIAMALTDLGHDVRVVLPLYSSIDRTKLTHSDQPMIVNMGYGIEFCRVWQCVHLGVRFLFIEFEKYFGRSGIYGENGVGYADNWARFAFFSRAAIDLCCFMNWRPDVIHSHDWHTGLIPVILRERCPNQINGTASVFTIHNMAHHGYSPRELLNFIGLPERLFHPFSMEACGALNIMKGAILYADKITTVSRGYANEIKTPEYGCGLCDLLRYRAADLIGICNAVDTGVWSPASDPLIHAKFSRENFAGKAVCKLALQRMVGLDRDTHVLLIGIISRFVEQKGLDVVCDILQDLLANLRVQFVILGAGDVNLERRFMGHMRNHAGLVAVKIGYDDALAHAIEAGSDCFLMPSRYEPCGMNQMYSMLYGTLPIVRATGGLNDTVDNYNEYTHTGSGFVFNNLDRGALYNTICWACSTYYDRREDFTAMQKYAMGKDFSLRGMANAYVKVYEYSVATRLS